MILLFGLLSLLLLSALVFLLAPVWRNPTMPVRQRHRLAAGLGLFLASCAFALYDQLGTPAIVPLLEKQALHREEVKATILRQSAEVKKHPDNIMGWVELGQAFMESGQYTAAANAFKQTVLLSNGDPQLILAYATALISEAGGKVTDDAQQSLQMVLMQKPDNAQARYFMAVRQLQDGNTQEAMKAMKELYHSLPDDSPVKAMIDAQIGRK